MRPRYALRLAAALTAGALSLTSAAQAAPSARPPVPNAVRMHDGGWAVPMKAKVPAWYDKAFHDKVIAAGTEGVRMPAGAKFPNGMTEAQVKAAGLITPGIRPGQWLATFYLVGFAWCSANFVFIKNGVYGLGTAGHCAANDALGSFPDVTAYVLPPVGQGLPGFYHIGKFVLSHNNGIGDDFAMIEIYPQYNSWINPSMPIWGGPTQVYTGTAVTPVEHIGHGAGVGTGGTPRAGLCIVTDAVGGNAFGWYGVGFEGDSGSAVNTFNGWGMGNFTHIVISSPGFLPGMLAGTRLTKILQIANGWSLVTGTWPVPTI